MALNPVDALAEGVDKGIGLFAVGVGDDLFNMSSQGVANASYQGKLLVDIATFTYNPLQDPTVLNSLKESALIYVIFLIMFLFVGGAWVQMSRLRTSRQFLGMDVKHTSTMKEFFGPAFLLIVCAPMIPFIMWLALVLNYVICSMIMTGILPSIIITPDNVTLYVAMGFIYALLSMSFVWRSLIIGISMGYCLVIIILIALPYTRKIGTGLFIYYIVMVFMQPVILAVTCVGVGVIQFIAPYNQSWQFFCFMVFGLLLLVVSLIFIMGPFTIMKLLGSAKNKIKLVM